MHSHREDRHRSTVAVIPWVVHPLVIEGEVDLREDGQLIIGFHNLLRARVRQFAVAHEDAQTARVEIALACGGDALVNEHKTDRVAWAAPVRAFQRQPCRNRSVDIGDIHTLPRYCLPCPRARIAQDPTTALARERGLPRHDYGSRAPRRYRPDCRWPARG